MLEHLNKDNLHHAYLIEGDRAQTLLLLFDFFEQNKIKTKTNPDFYEIVLDTLKIDDAHYIKSINSTKSFTNSKKIFLISANQILLEAQNAMLKIFEEPLINTHFFVLTPSVDPLLSTFVSRFYLIKSDKSKGNYKNDAEKFLFMSLEDRIDFIKSFVAEAKKINEEDASEDSLRTKALAFLNELENNLLMSKMSKTPFDIVKGVEIFEHLINTRKYLRQNGSNVKMLLESVAVFL